MYDPSGDGWMKHILFGTSKIIELRGPEKHRSGAGRSFFLTVRIFEIVRAIMFMEGSFLCKQEWKNLMLEIWTVDTGIQWHPKEDLYDILLCCVSLSARAEKICDSKYRTSSPPKEDLLDLAQEGLALQAEIQVWHRDAQEWSNRSTTAIASPHPKVEHDDQLTLAIIYYHTLSIYLSGIFDYRFHQFSYIATPTLVTADVQTHVQTTLTMTKDTMHSSNLSGLLFFFPLRVIGSRAESAEQRKQIIEMLQRIAGSGFVVARAFTETLEKLWNGS